MYKQPIFEHGAGYRVKVSFASGPASSFESGGILSFTGEFYSPYDDAFVYTFETPQGTEKEWWLAHGPPKESWSAYFEPLAG